MQPTRMCCRNARCVCCAMASTNSAVPLVSSKHTASLSCFGCCSSSGVSSSSGQDYGASRINGFEGEQRHDMICSVQSVCVNSASVAQYKLMMYARHQEACSIQQLCTAVRFVDRLSVAAQAIQDNTTFEHFQAGKR